MSEIATRLPEFVMARLCYQRLRPYYPFTVEIPWEKGTDTVMEAIKSLGNQRPQPTKTTGCDEQDDN